MVAGTGWGINKDSIWDQYLPPLLPFSRPALLHTASGRLTHVSCTCQLTAMPKHRPLPEPGAPLPEPDSTFQASGPKVGIQSPLDDSKEVLLVPVLMGCNASVQPAH